METHSAAHPSGLAQYIRNFLRKRKSQQMASDGKVPTIRGPVFYIVYFLGTECGSQIDQLQKTGEGPL